MRFCSPKQIGICLRCLALVFSLAVVLSPEGIAQANPKANKRQLAKIVLEAQTLIDEYQGQGDLLERANELLAKAVQLDRNYAPTYVQAARLTLVGGHIVSYEFAGGTLETAESLLRKAISLDPDGADAYVVLGHVSRLMGKNE